MFRERTFRIIWQVPVFCCPHESSAYLKYRCPLWAVGSQEIQVNSEAATARSPGSVSSISADDLRKLREAWTYSGTTVAKRLELVRAVLSFCLHSGLVERNCAKGIKQPRSSAPPTLPYSQSEWKKILCALDVYREIHIQSPVRIRRQVKALVLLMRYLVSGSLTRFH